MQFWSKKNSRSGALLFALFCCWISVAADGSRAKATKYTEINCPAELKIQEKVSEISNEWLPDRSGNEKYPLRDISFFQGEPGQRPMIKSSNGKAFPRAYDLDSSIQAGKEGYWVACVYAQTRQIIAKRISSEYRECVVEYDLRFRPPLALRAKCH